MSENPSLLGLTELRTRAEAARAVAQRYGAQRLIVYVREDEDDQFSAARGFEPLPLDGKLHHFLEEAAEEGRNVDEEQGLLALKVGESSALVLVDPASYDLELDPRDADLFHVLAVLFSRELDFDTDRTANRQVRTILESITDAFYLIDHDWRFTYANSQALHLLQRDRASLIGRNIWIEFPHAVGTEFHRQYRRAMEERVTVEFEEYYPEPLDAWFEVKVYPSPDGLSVYFREITERRQLEEHIRNVSTPILDIGDRVLLVPLIGLFDAARATLLSDRLLEAIRVCRARAAVIDITGLAVIDAGIVERLGTTLKGANLLGCETITVGVSSDVAREFVSVGGTPEALRTCLDLQSGIEVAHRLVSDPSIVRAH